ncbi:hypothetical protein GS421_09210 [Rhodococcus hoagii]|nr:hypothetical protein [Prescottella equi]
MAVTAAPGDGDGEFVVWVLRQQGAQPLLDSGGGAPAADRERLGGHVVDDRRRRVEFDDVRVGRGHAGGLHGNRGRLPTHAGLEPGVAGAVGIRERGRQ